MEKVLDESQPEKVVFNLNFVTGTVTWPVDAGILETLVTGNDLLPYPRTIIFEGFRLFPQMAETFTYNAMLPVEVIGFIRGIWMRNTLTHPDRSLRGVEIAEQFSSIKTTLPDPRLKEMVGDDYPSDRHARDAVRHIVHWLLLGDSIK
jgi:hypothetical protein